MSDREEALREMLDSELGAGLLRASLSEVADASMEAVMESGGMSEGQLHLKSLYESLSEISHMDNDEFREWALEDPEATLELFSLLNELDPRFEDIHGE